MSLQKHLPHLVHFCMHSAKDETVGGVIGALVTTAVAPTAVASIGGVVTAAGAAVGVTVGAPVVAGAVVVAGVVGCGVHFIKKIFK